MNVNNQMQMNVASHQLARFAEPSTSVGQANPEKSGIIEDQLTRFMDRAMSLNVLSTETTGSFVDCTSRFNGNEQELEKFILSITLYKDMEQISDDIALHELPLLLEGEAAAWWSKVKENVYSWPAAIKTMEEAFKMKKPIYEIYQQIFATIQDAYIPSEMFIRQKLALFAQLPRPLPEDIQIDMIYSMLKSRIQKKVSRNSITSIDQLINEANRVEHAKDNKRMRKFINFDFETMKPASKLKERCSHCRKSKKRGQMGDSDVDCYKCNSRQAKRSKNNKSETVNPVYAPLQGFNPNIGFNPFNK